MRVYVLFLLVAVLSVYAYRHWYRSLCALILLMAVIEHPDMPTSMLEIQGLNPWNVLLANVLLAWLLNRRKEALMWDMPRNICVLLLLYLFVVLFGFFRMIGDVGDLGQFTMSQLISEQLINTVKWVIPGLLLFDGARTRARQLMAIMAILVVYILLAVQVVRWMPASAASNGAALSARSLKMIQNEIGYSRVNMSRMLAGGSWALLAVLPLSRRAWHRWAVVAAFLTVAYGQALTGGRMGYVTWAVVGVVMCAMRWRKWLLLVPVMAIGVVWLLPGVAERTLQGFGATDVAGEAYVDDYEVTAGRTLVWPHVVEQIGKSPIVGYGRHAMIRTGLTEMLREEYGEGEAFPHPHNAYLELLLDNGIVGFVVVMPLFVIFVVRAAILFMDRRDSVGVASGGVAFAYQRPDRTAVHLQQEYRHRTRRRRGYLEIRQAADTQNPDTRTRRQSARPFRTCFSGEAGYTLITYGRDMTFSTTGGITFDGGVSLWHLPIDVNTLTLPTDTSTLPPSLNDKLIRLDSTSLTLRLDAEDSTRTTRRRRRCLPRVARPGPAAHHDGPVAAL